MIGEIIGNSVLSILDKLDLPFEKCVETITDALLCYPKNVEQLKHF